MLEYHVLTRAKTASFAHELGPEKKKMKIVTPGKTNTEPKKGPKRKKKKHLQNNQFLRFHVNFQGCRFHSRNIHFVQQCFTSRILPTKNRANTFNGKILGGDPAIHNWFVLPPHPGCQSQVKVCPCQDGKDPAQKRYRKKNGR